MFRVVPFSKPHGVVLTAAPLVELMLGIALIAIASTVNLNAVTPPPPGNTADPLWHHTPAAWFFNMGMQLALTVILAALTWWRLAQASPGRR